MRSDRQVEIGLDPPLTFSFDFDMSPIDVIFNKKSGLGQARATALHLEKNLGSLGHEARAIEIESWPTDRRAGALVIVGGDGTVKWAVERGLKSNHLPPIAIAPFGTANLLSIHLNHRYARGKIVSAIDRMIRTNRIRKIDLAQANGQAMLLMAGIGFDANVVHDLAARRTGPIKKLSYLAPIIRSILAFKPGEIDVKIDGKSIFKGRAAALVANIPEYGLGFSLAPNAKSDDGLLDVVVLPMGSLLGVVRQTISAAIQHRILSTAITSRGRVIEVDGNERVQIDGEASGRLPLKVEVDDRRVNFFDSV